jgi:signal peptidase I
LGAVGRVALFFLIAGGGLIAVAIVAFVLLGGMYRAPSESMLPTIDVGDRFSILKFGTPEVGDIVVHYPPAGAERDQTCAVTPPAGQMCAKPTPQRADVRFVKRVVAVGGDEISMRDGKLIRNGKPETTEGPRSCETPEGCNFPRPITVPKGHLFMLGDNRGRSDDSRFWGPVPEDWVIGRYWFKFG